MCLCEASCVHSVNVFRSWKGQSSYSQTQICQQGFKMLQATLTPVTFIELRPLKAAVTVWRVTENVSKALIPVWACKNKEKGLSLPLTHSCHSSQCQSLSHYIHPAYPLQLSRTITHAHTHWGPYGEACSLPLSPRLSPLSAPGRGGRISVPPNCFKNALYSLTLSCHTSCFVLLPQWSSTTCRTEWGLSVRGRLYMWCYLARHWRKWRRTPR